jgi:DNA polymerase-1
MTNAVYGFTSMLLKVLEEERPDMIAVAFDLPGPTFRHQQFADYKATRPKTPDELAAQIGMAREVLAAMHIPVYDYEGYEADDVIGTLASRAETAGDRVLIVTGDLDELQLVSDKVSVMVTRRGITDTKVYDVAAVQERYGFAPERLPDFRALKGDTTDNIPGVPGIGEKTAAELVKRFGTLEQVLAHAEEVTPARVATALEAHADLARQAYQLSIIVRDLPMGLDRKELAVKPPDRGKLLGLFRRLDFRSLAARLEASVPEGREATARVTEEPRAIRTAAQAAALARRLTKEKEIVVHPMADEGPGLRAQMRGLCVVSADGPAVLAEGADGLDKLLAALKPALESAGIAKVGHDLKRLALLLSRRGIALRGTAFDTMIASYLSNPSRRAHDLATAIYDHLESAAGEQFALEVSDEAGRAAAAAQRIAELKDRLSGKLREREQWKLFAELEMPLVQVLLDMELAGVAIDSEALAALSERLGQRIRELEQAIYTLAGEEFTIASPKQLQRILFDRLGLPPDKAKRTKTGYSTDAEVLGALSEHEIVASILEYREITKLKSTYVDVLPRLVDPQSGRLHTSFNQAVTATGRLSSSDPNLQNIPVRTELGSEIRRAFVAGQPEHVLLSADYSQIELRILAHITEDANLIEIFRRDEDLHRAAAMEIFGVGHDEITPAMRSFAKMVNFGIPYGISEFRLAREMGITGEEAHRYVQRYFARFPQLHAYVQEMPEQARETGYVTTLLGRRRYLPDLKARAPMVRQAAERMAVNTPMQGSAADIIKLAMLRVHGRLCEEGLTARMILQVHDELLLDVPRGELQAAARLVAECMSGAYELVVPLKVDLKAGPNWLEMQAVELQ